MNAQTNTTTNGTPQKIVAKDVHAKWDKISEQDAGNMKSTGDLATKVQSAYSLSAEQAKSQVDAWANGRSF
jgi:hypothetical protein